MDLELTQAFSKAYARDFPAPLGLVQLFSLCDSGETEFENNLYDLMLFVLALPFLDRFLPFHDLTKAVKQRLAKFCLQAPDYLEKADRLGINTKDLLGPGMQKAFLAKGDNRWFFVISAVEAEKTVELLSGSTPSIRTELFRLHLLQTAKSHQVFKTTSLEELFYTCLLQIKALSFDPKTIQQNQEFFDEIEIETLFHDLSKTYPINQNLPVLLVSSKTAKALEAISGTEFEGGTFEPDFETVMLRFLEDGIDYQRAIVVHEIIHSAEQECSQENLRVIDQQTATSEMAFREGIVETATRRWLLENEFEECLELWKSSYHAECVFLEALGLDEHLAELVVMPSKHRVEWVSNKTSIPIEQLVEASISLSEWLSNGDQAGLEQTLWTSNQADFRSRLKRVRKRTQKLFKVAKII